MANRVVSVSAVVLGASVVMSSFAITPAAAWTHHRHSARVYGYAPSHYATVVRRPVYGYPAAYGYGYAPGAVAGAIVNGAGAAAANIVGGAAALAGGILGGWPSYGYYGYPTYAYGYGYPQYPYGYGYPVW
jgi:hypothetical protein